MTRVLLEFQRGKKVLFFFIFCWITKKIRAHSGLDLQRQRFKAGLAGFCYLTCSRVGLGRKNNHFLTKTTKEELVFLLKLNRNDSGII